LTIRSHSNLSRWVLTYQEWEVIRFPAIKDKFSADYDPREEGEALWPNKHSKERMLQIKRDNPTTFNALYQQDPRPPENLLVFGDWGELNEWKPQGTKFYGLDLGYTNDPTALTEIWVNKRSGQKPMVYLKELIYKTGLNNATLMALFKSVGIMKSDTNGVRTMLLSETSGVHVADVRIVVASKDAISAVSTKASFCVWSIEVEQATSAAKISGKLATVPHLNGSKAISLKFLC